MPAAPAPRPGGDRAPAAGASVHAGHGWPSGLGALLRLTVAPEAASLAIVRHVGGGLATAVGMDARSIADVRLSLTEVCSALLQADGDGPRPPLEVVIDLVDDALRVVVRDPLPLPAGPDPPMPLSLVAAITASVELRRLAEGGSEVTM